MSNDQDISKSPPASAHPALGIRRSSFSGPTLDSVTTIRTDGSRPFLYPAATRGRFTRARQLAAAVLVVLYLSLPWIKINGHPAVLLDLAERRFHLFGLTFAAQDLWLLFFVITGVGFSLFFVTALFGRIWCGWACPQTVFLEHVYRPIERLIEGDSVQRRRLAAAPLSVEKLLRRTLKHAVYLLVSAVFTHLFLAYFVSVPDVWDMVRHSPVDHGSFFVFMAAYTGLTYFIFAWFREQVCIVLCPYGRIQSVLTDDHTLVIGYDVGRGEPRHHRRSSAPRHPIGDTIAASARTTTAAPAAAGPASAARAKGSLPSVLSAEGSAKAEGLAEGSLPSVGLAEEGDCVDCNRCVQVCPTGIDIRQGLQMECVGCTACIDACDPVMDRLRRPRGLIRYDSQVGFSGGRTRWLRPRTVLYFGLLLAGAAVAGWAISTVRPANFGVTRMTGAPYIVDAGAVRNQFLVRIVNKRNTPERFNLTLDRAPGGLRRTGFDTTVEIAPLGELVQPLVLQQPRGEYGGPFHFVVRIEDAAGRFRLQREVEFLGPEARLLREEEEEKRDRASRKQ